MSNESRAKRTFGKTFSPETQSSQKKIIMSPGGKDNFEDISNADIFKAIQDLQNSIKTLRNDVSEMNKNLTDRIETAENVIQQHSIQISSNKNEIERMRFSREIVLNGIPVIENEDVEAIFKSICNALGYKNKFPTVFVKRFLMKPRNFGDKQLQPPKIVNISPIFVEFAFYNEKRLFMEMYFKLSNLNVACIGLQNASRIYVNERLTKHDINIKVKALELKRKEKLHSVFIKDGRVFVKQTKTSLQVHIDDVLQLGSC